MVMRYRGGGVGHKSTRHVVDSNLDDLDELDAKWRDESEKVRKAANEANEEGLEEGEMDLDLPAEPELIDPDTLVGDDQQEDQVVDEEELDSEAENEVDEFGYAASSDEEEEEIGHDSNDADRLGPEDGEDADDEIDDRYADL
jgi:hypothetical protein